MLLIIQLLPAYSKMGAILNIFVALVKKRSKKFYANFAKFYQLVLSRIVPRLFFIRYDKMILEEKSRSAL